MSALHDKGYMKTRWELEEAAKRSVLGFWGFVVQIGLFVMTSFIASRIKSEIYSRESFLLLAAILTIPGAIGLWFVWLSSARRVRWILTEYLNLYVGEQLSFPAVSPINARYVPEIALGVAAQACILMTLFFIVAN